MLSMNKRKTKMYAYWIYYVLGIVLIPGIALGLWAQIKVQTTFNEYNKIQTKHGKPANVVARYMLDGGGCIDTKIGRVNGSLTDNYDPTKDTISLSDDVYDNSTVAAIGVTAHEIGHVFQHKSNYAPVKIRKALVPVVNISGFLVWPLIIVGLILEAGFYLTNAKWLILAGIILYSLNILFCLVTLPVELNASKRAYNMLVSTGEMDPEEAQGVKKVLNAAAWTYVAALITSVLSLIRLLLFVFTMRGNKK